MIGLLLTLAVIGFIVWLIVTYIPMPDVFQKGIIVIAVIFVLLYVLNALGVVGPEIPRLNR